MKYSPAVRQAVAIVCFSAALGFSYTAIYQKGFFNPAYNDKISSPSHSNRDTAPTMIPIETAKQYFDEGTAIFIDARHEFDYKQGHIKGAINIPLKQLSEKMDVLSALNKDSQLIIYCDGSECNSSIELAAKISLLGYSKVKIFFGGWKEWSAQQYPIQR